MKCYYCQSNKLTYINFHGEEFYECNECQHLTAQDGKQVRSVMEEGR